MTCETWIGPEYPDCAPWDLEPHYSRHVSAMTTEALHSKHDIAKQLALRDKLAAEAERRGELKGLEFALRVYADDSAPMLVTAIEARIAEFKKGGT